MGEAYWLIRAWRWPPPGGLWPGFPRRRPMPPTASPLWKPDEVLGGDGEKEIHTLQPRASPGRHHPRELCLGGQPEDMIRDNSSSILKEKADVGKLKWKDSGPKRMYF